MIEQKRKRYLSERQRRTYERHMVLSSSHARDICGALDELAEARYQLAIEKKVFELNERYHFGSNSRLKHIATGEVNEELAAL